MVRVPVPRSPGRAYRVITESLGGLFEVQWIVALFLGAALLTGVLCVPGVGIPLGALVLVIGALGYGELIRQCGIDFWDFDDWKRPGNLVQRVGVAVIFGLVMAAPLLLGASELNRPYRFTTLGLILGLVASIVLPLAMFLIYARDESGPLGWRRGGKVLLRYPLATLCALMLIPIGLVAAELAVIFFSSWQGMLPFFVLDLYPDSEHYAGLYKIPKFGNYTKFEFPDARFFRLYFRRFHHGYMLIEAIPASLSKETNILASPWTLDLDDMGYLKLRAIYTQIATMVILFFLTLQSFWLGAISTLESKRSLEN